MESYVMLDEEPAGGGERSDAEWSPPPDKPRGSVIGLGNPTLGDFGVGLHVIEALSQESPGPNVYLAPLGEEYDQLIFPLLDVEAAVISKGVSLGGTPGESYVWDLPEFRRRASLDIAIPSRLQTLAEWLERIEIGSCLPPHLRFVFVEVEETSGIVLSRAARAAIRTMVRTILSFLREQGVAQPQKDTLARIYSLSCLNITV